MKVVVYNDITNKHVLELNLVEPLVEGDRIRVDGEVFRLRTYRVVSTHQLDGNTQLVNVRTNRVGV